MLSSTSVKVVCVSEYYLFRPFTLLMFLPWLQVQPSALSEQHSHVYLLLEFLALHFGRTFTFSTPQPLILFSFPPGLKSSLSLLLWLFPDRPRANVHQMPPPPTPPHPHSLSLLTLCSIQTDGIAISPGFTPCLSRCLLHSTLSILPSSFLSLTEWKIRRERENKWKEKERERETQPLQPTYGPKPRVFLSDILSNVLSL